MWIGRTHVVEKTRDDGSVYHHLERLEEARGGPGSAEAISDKSWNNISKAQEINLKWTFGSQIERDAFDREIEKHKRRMHLRRR